MSYGYAHKQTDKFPGALHQGFQDLDQSIVFMRNHASSPENEWCVYDRECNVIPLVQHMDMRATQADQESPFSQVVISPVLTFVFDSLNNSAVELVRKTCEEFSSVDELVKARELLYAGSDKTILPKYIRRRDGAVTSEIDAVVNYIISDISKLDEQDKLHHLSVDVVGLNRLPKCIPAEINALSMYDRMRKLELRMKPAEEAMSENTGRTILIEVEVNNYRSHV